MYDDMPIKRIMNDMFMTLCVTTIRL